MSETSKHEWAKSIFSVEGQPTLPPGSEAVLDAYMAGHPVPRQVWIALRWIVAHAMRDYANVCIQVQAAEVRILVCDRGRQRLFVCKPPKDNPVWDLVDEDLSYTIYERSVDQSEVPTVNLFAMGDPS